MFDFDLNSPGDASQKAGNPTEKIMASAFKAGSKCSAFERLGDLSLGDMGDKRRVEERPMASAPAPFSLESGGETSQAKSDVANSTEYDSCLLTRSSGVCQQKQKVRRRPYIRKRQEQKAKTSSVLNVLYGEGSRSEKIGSKRKVVVEDDRGCKAAKLKESRVIPNEGSPHPR